MLRINYPQDRNTFEKAYQNVFKGYNQEDDINCYLSNVTYKGKVVKFTDLLILPFHDLVNFSKILKSYSNSLPNQGKHFFDLFKYSESQQGKIAHFFMNQKGLELTSCYYCNIDYINSFLNTFKDYKTPEDFVNKATLYELGLLKDIGPETPPKIKHYRENKKIENVEELLSIPYVVQKQIDSLKEFKGQGSHNHFTLDHVFPQGEYGFYALSLYNFVPSCYSCNSKFKNDDEFKINENLKYIIPSSFQYSLSNVLEFKPLYKSKKKRQMTLRVDYTKYKDQIQHYLKMFKLVGRYTFHKGEIERLMQLQKDYPPGKIKAMANKYCVSEEKLKSDIFGPELFDPKLANQPLTKFKKDIAKTIGII